MELRCGQVTLDIFDPSSSGQPFAPSPAGLALRVPDVDAARAELEAKGVEFHGETIETRVCRQAWFKDPDGNALMLHRRYDRRMRREADCSSATTRFRFRPRRTSTGGSPISPASTRSRGPRTAAGDRCAAVAARARRRRHRPVGEAAIEIETRPRGSASSALSDDHELLYSLVGWDEKFAAHNAAMWKHGLLVQVPRGVVLEKPLYVRIANAVEGGSLFWRLLVVAEPESRFSADRGVRVRQPELTPTRMPPSRSSSSEARRSSTSPSRTSRGAPGTSRRIMPAWIATPTRLGRRWLRLGEGEGADPERPRRPRSDLTGDRRLLRRRDPASRLRHVPGAHRAQRRPRTSRSRARSGTRPGRSGAG